MSNGMKIGSRISALGVALLSCMLIGCEQAPSWLNATTIQSQLQSGLNKMFTDPALKAKYTGEVQQRLHQELDNAVIGMEVGPFDWDIEDVYNVSVNLGTVAPTVKVKGILSWQTSTEYHCLFFFDTTWNSNASASFKLAHSGWFPPTPLTPFGWSAPDINVSLTGIIVAASGWAKVVIPKSTMKPTITVTVNGATVNLTATASIYFLNIDITSQVKSALDDAVYTHLINKGFKLSL